MDLRDAEGDMPSFDTEVPLSLCLLVPLPAWSGSFWRSDIARRVANRTWAQRRKDGSEVSVACNTIA